MKAVFLAMILSNKKPETDVQALYIIRGIIGLRGVFNPNPLVVVVGLFRHNAFFK